MTINDLLRISAPFTMGSNQVELELTEMNSLHGKRYYDSLINDHVLGRNGIYAFCDRVEGNVLYIGKGGTVQNNGSYKSQNLNGRLKAPRGSFNSSYGYVHSIMNEHAIESLSILVLYSEPNYPPAYLEAVCLLEYLNQHSCLPMFNNEF